MEFHVPLPKTDKIGQMKADAVLLCYYLNDVPYVLFPTKC